MERDQRVELKVGLFVAMGIVLVLVSFAILGGEKKLFERNYPLHAHFSDISGLRSGAGVRLAGMDVGMVTHIEFPEDLADRQVHVQMRIAQSFQERIRKDSLATIQGQGLLGDKYVSLSMGSAEELVLNPGDVLETEDPVELTAYLDDVPRIMENIKSISEQIDKMLKGEDGEEAGKSIGEMLASLRNILQEVEQGGGVIHQLVYDEDAGENLKRSLQSIGESTDGLAALLSEVRDGDGALHSLIYEDHITSLLHTLQGTAGDIDGLVVEIKTGEGLLHDLVYTEKGQSLLANLTDASGDIKEVVASIRRGDGTLGALIADPTLYEDVKSLVGKAERNKILKAFVRDSIRRNEREEGVPEASHIDK